MREKEILDNIGLVYTAIKKMNFQQRNDDEEWDEIYNSGIIGLIKAVDTYNEKKNIKKSTYYFQCIANEIKHLYISKSAQKRNYLPLSLDRNISKTDVEFYETLASDINIENDYIKKEEIDNMLVILEKYRNKKHIKMIKENFGIGCEKKTIKEIAKEYGTSNQNISQAKDRLLKWLRKELEKYDDNNKEKEV
jgi:RNA polymerase sporulation-specific sigma factor